MGIKKDIKEHKLKNILSGWKTSFIGVVLFSASILLPFEYKGFTISFDPELYVRGIMASAAVLAFLAPDKLPSIITEAWSIVKKLIKLK